MAEMLIVWLLVPLALLLLCFGVGMSIATLTKTSKEIAQVLVIGFLGTSVIGSLLVLDSKLAKFVAPVLGFVGITGLIIALVRRNGRANFDSSTAIAGTLTYLVFSLPGLSYGKPTWAGWVQLDDNSSWYAITYRLMTLGHSIPSPILTTYDRVIQTYLGGNQFNYAGYNGGQFSYPTGALIPFGTISKLTGVELAWLFQPYLAFCAGLLSMIYVLILKRRIVKRINLILGAVLASSASTYFSYAMWGGIKEIVLTIPITYFAFTFFASLDTKYKVRHFIIPFFTLVALYFIGEKTSFAFIIPIFVVGILLVAEKMGRSTLFLSFGVVGLLTLFVIYSLVSKNFLYKMVVPTIVDNGNLYGHLNPLQIMGIWPSRDFRVSPMWAPVTYLFILLALALSFLGVWEATKRGDWVVPVLVLSTTSVFGFSRVYAGVWLTGKAIAVASPIFLLACVLGLRELYGFIHRFPRMNQQGAKVATLTFVLSISGGVILSNFMTYQNIWFAPYSQIDELRSIGHKFAGQGPTLMTEYSPYGARYLLREIGAEAAGELRVHVIPMRDGNQVPKGAAADIDMFDSTTIDYFNLLVLRSAAAASRPPLNYSLAWSGSHYEVWKRNRINLHVKRTLALGNNYSAGSTPTCDQVGTFLAGRLPSEKVFTAIRSRTYLIPLGDGDLPVGWTPSAVIFGGVNFQNGGAISRNFSVETESDYSVWLAGSYPGALKVLVDGNQIFLGKSLFEGNAALSNPLGKVLLTPGSHLITIIYKMPFFQAGAQVHSSFGPILLTSQTAAQTQVQTVSKIQVPDLCKQNLDWIAIAR